MWPCHRFIVGLRGLLSLAMRITFSEVSPAQDAYGVRPPYGVVVLAHGMRERVTFTEPLERGVVRAMAEMRRVLATGKPQGPRWEGAKCRACGYHPVCWDDDEARTQQ